MSRIPARTVQDAPEASRPLLENVIQCSPTGRPLNMHAQMTHSPAVLVAYTLLRAATSDYGTLGPRLSTALMFATATAIDGDYVVAITGRLAHLTGWADSEVAALQAGNAVGDNKIDTLTRLVREAAVDSGNVADTTWNDAPSAGRDDEQLAGAFAYLGLTVFTA